MKKLLVKIFGAVLIFLVILASARNIVVKSAVEAVAGATIGSKLDVGSLEIGLPSTQVAFWQRVMRKLSP